MAQVKIYHFGILTYFPASFDLLLILVGHSYGALLARINYAQYPEQVSGIVMVDGMPLELDRRRFSSEGEYERWKTIYDVSIFLLWQGYGATTRLGLLRLTEVSSFLKAGYPPAIAKEISARQARIDRQLVVVHTPFAYSRKR